MTWKHVEDIELYDTMGEKQKFAYCKGTTRQCTLEKPEDSPPSFWNRLEQKHDSILLTGIQEDDEGLGMRVKIHLTRSAYRAFTLRIRLGTPQGSPQLGKFPLEFNMNLFCTSNVSPPSIHMS